MAEEEGRTGGEGGDVPGKPQLDPFKEPRQRVVEAEEASLRFSRKEAAVFVNKCASLMASIRSFLSMLCILKHNLYCR